MKKCPGYKGHVCGKVIADWFRYCEDCNFHFKVQDEMEAEKQLKEKEFMQDKQALGTNIN